MPVPRAVGGTDPYASVPGRRGTPLVCLGAETEEARLGLSALRRTEGGKPGQFIVRRRPAPFFTSKKHTADTANKSLYKMFQDRLLTTCTNYNKIRFGQSLSWSAIMTQIGSRHEIGIARPICSGCYDVSEISRAGQRSWPPSPRHAALPLIEWFGCHGLRGSSACR